MTQLQQRCLDETFWWFDWDRRCRCASNKQVHERVRVPTTPCEACDYFVMDTGAGGASTRALLPALEASPTDVGAAEASALAGDGGG